MDASNPSTAASSPTVLSHEFVRHREIFQLKCRLLYCAREKREDGSFDVGNRRVKVLQSMTPPVARKSSTTICCHSVTLSNEPSIGKLLDVVVGK